MKNLKNAWKYSLHIMLSFLISSCELPDPGERAYKMTNEKSVLGSEKNPIELDAVFYTIDGRFGIAVVVLDSCEYVLGDESLIHKGNCKNHL
jgi:hypothetical protein